MASRLGADVVPPAERGGGQRGDGARAIVEDHLDAMQRTGAPADLVEAFALPVPSLVICELLGVPYADREAFQRRTARIADLSIPLSEAAALQREEREYMAALVTAARRRPGDNLLGTLVGEHGDDLTDNVLTGVASLLLRAGQETTSNALALGALALLCHPDQAAAVRENPDAVRPAIEELLRWMSIAQISMPRFTTTEVDVAGVRIPAGRLVFASLSSASRDPAAIEDPDTLDITRGASRHLAFGHGVHHCLGAPLARMQMAIALPALLRRFPDLALAEPFDQVAFRPSHFVYGLQSLTVTW